MSLAETQQIMQVLQEIMALLNGVEFKTTKLQTDQPKTERALQSFTQLERVALRYLVLARHLGLPDDFNRATQVIAKLVIMVRMLQMAMHSLTMGPVGTLLGIAEITMVAVTVPNLLEGY